jgi:hypothetical protein
MKTIHQLFCSILLAFLLTMNSIAPAWAFGGFYVSGINKPVSNRTSQVIIARSGEDTVLTMATDFQGNVRDFALVVPVPGTIKPEQVGVADRAILQKLDTFTQPRLVEYIDTNPCIDRNPNQATRRHISLQGLTIENNFSAGEYNVSILSATDANNLETWLRGGGYQLPPGASELLKPYIRQQMKFLVAKVNLAEFNKNGGSLRPLQIAYRSPKFMLPIRLGMLNAQGDQDLVLYLLSARGRVEVTNYRTAEMPTNQEVPAFAKSNFSKFYNETFQNSYQQAGKKVVFLEHAWLTKHCDPCTTSPPSSTELRQAGVFWPDKGQTFITRLHLRYQRDRFPEDLIFQETNNQSLFQSRYISHQTYGQTIYCGRQRSDQYHRWVAERQHRQIANAVRLTGRRRAEIEAQTTATRNVTPTNTTPRRGVPTGAGNRPNQSTNNPATTLRRTPQPIPTNNLNPVRDQKPATATGRGRKPETSSGTRRDTEPATETDQDRKPETTSGGRRDTEPATETDRGRKPESSSGGQRDTEPAPEADRERKPETESSSRTTETTENGNRGRNSEPASDNNRGRDPDSGTDSSRHRGR